MTVTIKPAHKSIQTYYESLKSYTNLNVSHETGVRTAFQNMLTETARTQRWTLITEQTIKVGGKHIRPDGIMRDEFNLPRGYWEAKDTGDDLDVEIKKKSAKGYPLSNIIFEDTRQAALYQDGHEKFRADLTVPQQVADLLNLFYSYTEPDIQGFEQAVAEFQERVKELAEALADKIKTAHKANKKFEAAYETFFELCRTALNPNISRAAVDEMLVQHLLTERLIRKIFDNPDFMNNNAIAVEIEKVIRALVSSSFNREEYLKSLDRFYRAIEDAAHGIEDFTEKQHFLNSIYERFFQGYSVKIADTHGIVYTPQPIVDFMCASVVEVLQAEFGKTLGDSDVMILDPATGTGNFIVNLLRRIPKRDLEQAYKNRLFANEVMLLPYYIAALNIEHAYYELTGQYESFEGLCFVDTLDIAEGAQMRMSFMTEGNSVRVERQKQAPITVIIGNPPYNVGQQSENDNNKNRPYEVIDKRIAETYVRDSNATLRNKLYDPYLKFFRWASDRLQNRNGIVCLVTNNGFLRGIGFDGFRKHLTQKFDRIYHFDFKGNARISGELRRQEGGNIFDDQIRVGIGITLLIRTGKDLKPEIFYHTVGDYWKAEQKRSYLASFPTYLNVPWLTITPDSSHTWLVPENTNQFATFLPIGGKDSKAGKAGSNSIFKLYSGGVKTNRDDTVYDFDREQLTNRMMRFVEDYNSEVDRFKRAGHPSNIDSFVRYNLFKWDGSLKDRLKSLRYGQFDDSLIRNTLYRPFSKRKLYFDWLFLNRVYQQSHIFPKPATEQENRIISLSGIGHDYFSCLISDCITDIACPNIGHGVNQCFPFYTYDEDGSNRRENITDWALKQFRDHYDDPFITKWDIFYYVYGLLHHPDYCTRFADNLKRELPRIPFAPDFRTFSAAGRKLADLHLNYEQVAPYKLQWIEAKNTPLSYRVEKMRPSKDKTQLVVNDSLTLAGIPPEALNYRLGNRSALDWVIDQYQVSTDKRSGITSDPNRDDDPRYIVDLVGRVITVSVETVKIVASLPAQFSA